MGTMMAFRHIQNQGFTPGQLQEILDQSFLSFFKVPRLPMLAYRPDVSWLLFFEERYCEGCNASNGDACRLFRKFKTPVLDFSIYDRDVLLVSYSDAA